MKRKLLLGLLSLVAAFGMVAVLLSLEYDAPELGNRVLATASEPGLMEIEAQGFRLAPLRGLRLEGVQARTVVDGGTLYADIDSVVLRHRLRPLLSRRLVLEELVLENPDLRLVSATEATDPASPAPPVGGSTASGEVSEPEDSEAGSAALGARRRDLGSPHRERKHRRHSCRRGPSPRQDWSLSISA